MTDWLELLWAAAEEGTELTLYGALHPAAAPEQGEGDTSPVADIPAAGKGEFSALQRRPAPELTGSVEERAAETLRFVAAPSAAGQGSVEMLRKQTGRTGLTALYRLVRQTVEHTLPAAPDRKVPAAVREEIGSAPPAGLTEEGLDRALRRDGRRYDGGMSIY